MSYVIVYLPDGEIMKPLQSFEHICIWKFSDKRLAEHAILENRVLRCDDGFYLNTNPVKDPTDSVPRYLLEVIEVGD
jgi:hypothetical protein